MNDETGSKRNRGRTADGGAPNPEEAARLVRERAKEEAIEEDRLAWANGR